MNHLLSVIVPVYNVELYLDRCIKSLVNQSYDNLEIILVNDGSTDNSLKICKEWSKKDSRIVVLDQENSGSSIARNLGLDNASGDIIGFVDSDDYLDTFMYNKMISALKENNLDVVEIKPIDSNKVETINNVLGNLILEDTVSTSQRIIKSTAFSVWRRIYKKEIIKGMRFIPGIIHQDVFYTIDVLKKTSKFGYIPLPLYVYNVENLSVIRSKYSLKKIQTGIRATEYIENNVVNSNALNQTVNNYVNFYYTDHFFLLSRNKHIDLDKKFRKKLKKRISETLNENNRTLRSTLIILLPIWCLEIISLLYQKIKDRRKKNPINV